MSKLNSPTKALNRVSQKYRNVFFVLLIALAMSMLIFSPAITLNTSAYSLASPQQPSIDDAISSLTTAACSDINFPNPLFSTGSSPSSVAIGDLDGDGKADLAVANQNSNTVSVLRSTSTSGTITPTSFATKVDFATGNSPFSVAIGDLDGDGKLDLAVSNFNDNTVSVLRNTSTNGNTSFATKVDFATGILPFSVAIGDLDGDGKADLATANSNSNTVSVLRNTSTNGNVSFATNVDFTTGSAPSSVAIGDLDGDGKADLAITNNSSNTVSVLRNTSTSGNTSFATKVDFATGSIPLSVAIGDIDGDGKADLAVANQVSTVSTLRNTSTIANVSFAGKVDFVAGLGSFSVALRDIDGDGKVDLATANKNNNTVLVLRNTSTNGSISFTTQQTFATSSSPSSVALGDLDGDGKVDLAVSNSNPTVSVFRNTSTSGNISFATNVDFTTGSFPALVAIGDLDGDGKADLAVANNGSNTVSVFRNTSTSGNVSFATKVDFTTGSSPVSVVIGDIDGDGKADLAVPNAKSNTVSVLRNTSTSGNVSFATNVDFTTGSSPQLVVLGDLDGDGKADLAVPNAKSNTVSVLRNTSTSSSVSFATNVDFAIGINPFSIALGDLDGNGKADLVVTNLNSSTVSVLRNTSTSGAINSTSFATLTFTTGIRPLSVAIRDIDGDGKLDLAIANQSSTSVSVLGNSCSLANTIDHSTLYVADTLNNRIQRSTNNGMSWQALGNGGGVGIGQFNAPRGVAADSTDTIIFVADTTNNRVQRSTNGGSTWAVIASPGIAVNQVNQPSGVAYDQVNSKLYIADTANNRILVVTNPTSSSPTFAIFAGASAGTTVGKVNQPQSVTIDVNGKIYVADTANNRIQVNSNGLSTGWTVLATTGTALGQVIAPKGAHGDGSGRVFIADTGNNRIQVNTNGVWSVFMSVGTAVGTVNRPEGVVVNISGNVFVADTGNNRIQSKPASGGTATVVGAPGLGVGQFNQPSGIR